jgi:hypothetical protein
MLVRSVQLLEVNLNQDDINEMFDKIRNVETDNPIKEELAIAYGHSTNNTVQLRLNTNDVLWLKPLLGLPADDYLEQNMEQVVELNDSMEYGKKILSEMYSTVS